MKRSLLCILLFVFLLVGCSTDMSIDEAAPTKNDVETPTKNDVGTPTRDDVENPTDDDVDHVVPRKRPTFNTLAEVKAFFDEEGTSGADTTDSIKNYIEDDMVAEICNMADKMFFPTADQSYFGSAIYYEELNSLDIIFGCGGIQYRFVYFFDCDYVWESETGPELLDVQVGPYMVDFWKVDHPNFPYEYYGFVKTDGVYLMITGLGEDLSGFSFDYFDFVLLSSVAEAVVE